MFLEIMPGRAVKVEDINYFFTYPDSTDSYNSRKLEIQVRGTHLPFIFSSSYECQKAYQKLWAAINELNKISD